MRSRELNIIFLYRVEKGVDFMFRVHFREMVNGAISQTNIPEPYLLSFLFKHSLLVFLTFPEL